MGYLELNVLTSFQSSASDFNQIKGAPNQNSCCQHHTNFERTLESMIYTRGDSGDNPDIPQSISHLLDSVNELWERITHSINTEVNRMGLNKDAGVFTLGVTNQIIFSSESPKNQALNFNLSQDKCFQNECAKLRRHYLLFKMVSFNEHLSTGFNQNPVRFMSKVESLSRQLKITIKINFEQKKLKEEKVLSQELQRMATQLQEGEPNPESNWAENKTESLVL